MGWDESGLPCGSRGCGGVYIGGWCGSGGEGEGEGGGGVELKGVREEYWVCHTIEILNLGLASRLLLPSNTQRRSSDRAKGRGAGEADPTLGMTYKNLNRYSGLYCGDLAWHNMA